MDGVLAVSQDSGTMNRCVRAFMGNYFSDFIFQNKYLAIFGA